MLSKNRVGNIIEVRANGKDYPVETRSEEEAAKFPFREQVPTHLTCARYDPLWKRCTRREVTLDRPEKAVRCKEGYLPISRK